MGFRALESIAYDLEREFSILKGFLRILKNYISTLGVEILNS